MQLIPEYAYSWRPYASKDLIVREFIGPNEMPYSFIIDPWTQNWVIADPFAVHLMALCNGKRRFSEVFRELLAEFGDEIPVDLSELVLQLREKEIIFCSAEDHKISGRPVYNSCDMTGMHIEITNGCNMTCTHCYVSSGKQLESEMDMETIYKTIDTLPPFSGKRVAISGGEPIVRKGCMDLVEYCVTDCGHDVDLYTNGRKFPRKYAERILSINENNIHKVRIQVSLEGATAKTNDAVRGDNSFNDACNSLQMFQDIRLGQSVIIFVCLTKNNINDLDAIIKLAEQYDVGMLVFSQWQRQGNAKDTPWDSIAPSTQDWIAAGEKIAQYSNPFLQVYGNFYGDLGNNEIGRFCMDSPIFPKHVYYYNAFPRITPQGDVLADQMWVDPEWMLGNVKEDDLRDCFKTPKFHGQLQDMEMRLHSVEDCQKCDWQKLCECGSPGHTYAEYGHMNEKDLFCESRKYWFELYMNHQINKVFGQGMMAAPSLLTHMTENVSASLT